MKRSKVIKNLESLLIRNYIHLPESANEIAEVLLFECERLGMQPPLSCRDFNGCDQLTWTWDLETSEINNNGEVEDE